MTRTSLGAVSEVRAVEFPHLDGSTFLNAASFGPLPRRSRAAAEAVHRMREEAPARFADFDFVAALDRCRAAAAQLVGAESSEIALGPNTSFGLNLPASLLPLARSLDGGTSARCAKACCASPPPTCTTRRTRSMDWRVCWTSSHEPR